MQISKSSSKLHQKVSHDPQDLEQQLAYLKWRRQNNEYMMKDAINRTKQLQERDQLQTLSVDRLDERTKWRKEIIRDELSKPLRISEKSLLDFEERQVKDQQHYHNAMVSHIDTLKKVKAKVKRRQQLQDEQLEKSVPINPFSRVNTAEAMEQVSSLQRAVKNEGKVSSYPRHKYIPDKHSPPWSPNRYNVPI